MNTILNYIFESSISVGILFLYYFMVLKQTPYIQFKRIYLIGLLLFSAVLPLLHFQIGGNSFSSQTAPVTNVLESFTVVSGELSSKTIPVVKSNNWMSWLYGIGACIFALRIVLGVIRIGTLRGLFQSRKNENYRLFISDGSFHPFSFFKWVFIPRQLWESDCGKIVLEHEKVHAQQWHSLDIILLEIILCFQWFNPVMWIIRKEMKNNHEFLADRKVLSSGIRYKDYAKSMLFQMVGTRFEIANNFSLSLTQKRIKMMKIDNRTTYHWIKKLPVILLFGMLTIMFACDFNSDESIKDASYVIDEKNANLNEEPVFFVVEEMPEYPGGRDSLMQYLRTEIRYPAIAQENKITGRVYVEFVISSTGKIKNIVIQKSVDEALDNEAKRVVANMPDWKPGKQRGKAVAVKYILPINFMLQSYGKPEKTGGVIVIDDVTVNQKEFNCDYKINTNDAGSKVMAGILTDSDNQPLPGVNIISVDDSQSYASGTVSDVTGEFTLKLKDTSTSVVLSFVGMKTIRIPLN